MDDNEIIEINEDNSLTSTQIFENLFKEENVIPEKTPKKKRNIDKKKLKICLIIGGSIILVIGIILILYFVIFNKEKEEEPILPDVVIEKDNYKYVNGSLVFLNSNDKEIGSYECINKDDSKCYVLKNDLTEDSFDRNISVYEDDTEIFNNLKIYNNNYVFINDGDKKFLYSINDNKNELDILSAKSYDTTNNYVVVEDEKSRYGLINITDNGFEYVIRASYDYLGMVDSENIILLAKDKDNYYLIDEKGEKLTSNIKYTLKSGNKDYLIGIKNERYSLYNYDNEVLFGGYDYIKIEKDLIILIKNKRLYLMDTNLNKYNEDGIRLVNEYYNKEYIYNDKNRLINTNKSFDITNKEEVIEVVADNTTTTISKYEININKNMDFINYFGGKLYFYGDAEKTDLLGTYNCKYDNILTKESTTLNNCNIYSTNDGTTGIYNNEFVFISDKDESNGLIYLYDLKDSKVKGTYDALELNDSNLEPMVSIVYTSNKYFVARTAVGANKGHYGVIMITSDNVKGKVPFDYKQIIKQKDGYVMLDKNNIYSWYSLEFELYYTFVNKNNNHYLFKNIKTEEYAIFDDKMNMISKLYDFIELYDNYFVGIKNNSLNIYDYKETAILNRDLEVTNNEYKLEYNNGYNITINNSIYQFDKDGNYIKEGVDNGE